MGWIRTPTRVGSTPGCTLVPVTDSFDEILAADDIEAVLLITPPSTHLELALRALEAGKQVFCEKPLTLRRADAVTMLEAFAAQGKVLGIDHERRFEPGWEELQERVKSGGLGKDTARRSEPFAMRGMGDLPDGHWRGLKTEGPSSPYTGMGIHFMDLFTSLFGPLDQVFSYAVDRTIGFASGDVSTAQFRFPDGTTGTIAAIASTPVFIRVAVFGDEGWMEVREAIDDAGIRRSEVTLSMRDKEVEHRVHEPTDTVRSGVGGVGGRGGEGDAVSVPGRRDDQQCGGRGGDHDFAGDGPAGSDCRSEVGQPLWTQRIARRIGAAGIGQERRIYDVECLR